MTVTNKTEVKAGKKVGYNFTVTIKGFSFETTMWADSKDELEIKYNNFVQVKPNEN